LSKMAVSRRSKHRLTSILQRRGIMKGIPVSPQLNEKVVPTTKNWVLRGGESKKTRKEIFSEQ